MSQNYKIPLIATALIMALFIMQGVEIFKLNIANKNISNAYELANESKNFQNAIKSSQNPTSLIYSYALTDVKGRILVSNLAHFPSNLDFQTLSEGGYFYHKSYFYDDTKLYYLILAKKLNSSWLVFMTFSMLSLVMFAVFITIYLAYLAAIKPQTEAKRLMNSFFNDAMHEIKTPLGVAMINLEMLSLRDKHTHRIKSALKQMKLTYEDVEYYIKHSYIAFEPVKLNFSDFLCARIKFCSTIANVKKIEILAKIDDGIFILISEIEATRLIDNTISNAIKYSPPNSQIIISLTKNLLSANFSVKDFGRGIKDTKVIWKRYAREDTAQGGFGLGLNIVRSICHKFGIIYGVDSTLGVGSTFFYTLPLYKDKLLDKTNVL